MEKNNNEFKSKVKRVFMSLPLILNQMQTSSFFGNCFHFYEWKFRNHVEYNLLKLFKVGKSKRESR